MQKSENITVAIRVRPLNKKEESDYSSLKINSETQSIELGENKFSFDHIFDHNTSQEKLFNTVAKNSIESIRQGYNVTIFAYGNTGCLDPDTPVLMFDGKIKKAKDIVIGDLLMGDDSTPRTVLQLFSGEDDIYDVFQSSGNTYRVNKSHVLTLKCPDPKIRWNNKGKYKVKWYEQTGKKTKTFQIYNNNNEKSFHLAVQFLKTLPKNVYIDIPLEEYLKKSNNWKKYHNGIKTSVEYPEKHLNIDPYIFGLEMITDTIPEEFLINSRKNRLKLLAGILDRKEPLSNILNIQPLIESLGFIFQENKIYGNFLNEIPVNNIHLKNIKRNNKITIKYVGRGKYNGFMLDKNHRFLLGDFTVTHNSGKSYTMFGKHDSKVEQGIIPRACENLFQPNSNDVLETNIKCSFLEIYRENIKDLLDKTKKNIKIRCDPLKGVYVQGIVEKYVYNKEEILDTIKEGTTQRTIASTALNSVSSRSHAVFTLTIIQKLIDQSEIISKLHLIDLAGSENVAKSEVQGISLSEAQTINKSLSSLGNVINALTEKGREHIPYRDSKLTYLLQDSLGGNAKTILIATVSPSMLSYSETINTLKFAKRAKEIKNIPKINKNESVANLLQIVEKLNSKIVELENKCQDSEAIIQAVQQAESDNKQLILSKTKCERLERKILFMEDENKRNIERIGELKQLFRKQRELARKVSKDLYKERIKNYSLGTEIEQLRFFYNSIQESINTPEILPHIINRTKIGVNVYVDNLEDDEQIEVIEIDSP